jgi:quercetin dioxygenase-like cupin family protein
MDRPPEITAFLAASADALRQTCHGQAARAAADMIARFGTRGPAAPGGARLPACDWIAPALAAAPPERQALAAAFAGVEGRLRWTRRAKADPADRAFWDGHANAVILGPGGVEDRDDLWVGVTVLAPGVRYPDHDHPPEEIYLPLGPGEWWNADMDWTDPGPAGFIYNPPGIRHAMRAGPEPFLAVWYLPQAR